MKFNSIEHICAACQKPFFVQPNQIANGEGVYCSRICYTEGRKRPLADRLWEKVDMSGGPDTCWPYATRTKNTYGLIYDPEAPNASHIIGAHVAAYRLTYGPIPDGMWVLHRCPPPNTNKRCCNPTHLYLGTSQDNVNDAIADGVRLPRKEERPVSYVTLPGHGKTRLSDEDVRAIRLLYGTWTIHTICEHFGIAQHYMSQLLRGDSRPEAGGPIKAKAKGVKTHCKKGHPLTEGNIKLTKGGTIRNCKICYTLAQREKASRFAKGHRAQINERRRERYAKGFRNV